ncbi:hypothetical protein [Paenibacillus sp. 1001270B_150601_E10]|uniref:hypothetical protein n=1 Tax=Paenibacillus sp. 1001270B_150601_E10 TaxID=2787079 RepID=UPI00189FF3FA|nr:hypothetical protein [Paenibacillus sp. 1001270B_150601_E10]
MRFKRVAALVLLGSIIGGTYVSMIPQAHAEGTDRIDVQVNGRPLSDAGIMVDGRTYLSVRDLQDSIQGFIYWDAANKKLYIDKPNVHMITFKDKNMFGKVQAGKTTFSVHVQVDDLLSKVDGIRLTIVDPNGKATEIEQSKLSTQEDNFWFRSKDFTYDFKAKGKYTINCYLKQQNGDYSLVSQKTLDAI